VIAAANPKNGWIDDFQSLKDQIGLPGPFLQRFDLIYILRDVVDLEQDERIIRHMIGVRGGQTSQDKYAPDIDPDMFRKYVAFSKQQAALKWTKAAEDSVSTYYLKVRNTRKDTDKPVPITPRQGNSLARLAEASARIRLSPKVEPADVDRAEKILDECLLAVAYDPKTGTRDIGNAATGKSKKMVDIDTAIISAIRELSDPVTGRALHEAVVSKLSRDYGGKDAVEKSIAAMVNRDRPDVIKPNLKYLKVI
jgi:replicative DNA helicase Mcm